MSVKAGEEFLDSRIIPDNFDWQKYDEPAEVDRVREPASFRDEVVSVFYGDESTKGELWPWDKVNREGMRFRPGEVTLYAGINGHYKSMITGQVACHLARNYNRVLIASFEMRPSRTIARMIRQSSGEQEPSLRYIDDWNSWSDGKIWLYDHLGNISERKVYALIRYVATELGVTQIVIDSLMKCVPGTDDYTAQKLFVGTLMDLAKTHNVHIHLVAHARKGKDEFERLDKFSVRGAGEIMDQVDNGILIQRNKLKSKGSVVGDGMYVDPEKPDVWLSVVKQRDGEFEGTFGLWFNSDSLCAVENYGDRWSPIDTREF